MKILTENDLKEYLRKEVEKIAISEGWIQKPTSNTIEFESSENDIVSESENVQIEDVKLLAEEMKRMKELIDFRSPLLTQE